MSRPTAARKLPGRTVRVLGKILYWAAVLAISVALLIALVLLGANVRSLRKLRWLCL